MRFARRLVPPTLVAASLLAAPAGSAKQPAALPSAAMGAAAVGGISRAIASAVEPATRPSRPRAHEIEWRDSEALGIPEAGRLRRGVMLPSEGLTWVSWDPVERDKPNRWWRRWGTDRLVRTTLAVIRSYAADHPRAPRVLIGDLSRPHGGDFGTAYGPIGHASHQNGLDVDVYYPRADGREWTPRIPSQVDLELAQDLVDRFVAAGAERVFVGPSLGLSGPPGVVVPLTNHDNHLHFRLPADG
jgi:murein endopeptidase